MSKSARTTFVTAFLLAVASIPGQAKPLISCAQYMPPFSGPVGFIILEDNQAQITAYEAPQLLGVKSKVSGFQVCIPVDLTRYPRIGAINIKFQIYNSAHVDAPSAAAEYDGPNQYSSQVRQFRTTSPSYPTINIDTYQKYHGCNDLNKPDYIKYRDYNLSSNFHVAVGNQRTDATPQQRAKFLFTRDVPPSCGLTGALGQFVSLLGVQPAFGDTFTSRLDSTIQSRRSILRKYDFSNAQRNMAYVTYELPRIDVGQCLRVDASYVFDTSTNGPVVIGHACHQ
jgi:hypothetical protein